MSLPAAPSNISLPALPEIVSLFVVPRIESANVVPIKFPVASIPTPKEYEALSPSVSTILRLKSKFVSGGLITLVTNPVVIPEIIKSSVAEILIISTLIICLFATTAT